MNEGEEEEELQRLKDLEERVHYLEVSLTTLNTDLRMEKAAEKEKEKHRIKSSLNYIMKQMEDRKRRKRNMKNDREEKEIQRKIRLRIPQFKNEEERAKLKAKIIEDYKRHYPHNTMEEKEAMWGIDLGNGKRYEW